MNCSNTNVEKLLELPPMRDSLVPESFRAEQLKDPHITEIILYTEHGDLPDAQKQAYQIVTQAHLFAVVENILYFVDPKWFNRRRAVVPQHLCQTIMRENHGG